MKKSKIFIIFFLLLSNQFMFILPSYISNGLCYKTIIVISTLIIILNINIILKKRVLFAYHVTFFIILCGIEILRSMSMYNQSFLTVLTASYYNFIIIVYLILNFYFDENNFKFIKKIIVYFSFLMASILLIQWYIFQKTGLQFLNIDLTKSMRFGEIRVTAGSFFISFGIIIALANLINNKKSFTNFIINILTIFVGTLELTLVTKTRTILICLLISITLMILIGIKQLKYKILIILVLSIPFIYLSNQSVTESYINSFHGIGNDFSSTIRIEATKYYINQIKENLTFGMGFIDDSNDSSKYNSNYYILRGNDGLFYRDDVGIVGFTNTFGLMGLIWYISLFCIILKVLVKSFRRKVIYNYVEMFGLVILVIMWSGTLIITDYGRNTNLPILLVMIEYLHKINTKDYKINAK